MEQAKYKLTINKDGIPWLVWPMSAPSAKLTVVILLGVLILVI